MKAIEKTYHVFNIDEDYDPYNVGYAVSKEPSARYDWTNQPYSEGKIRIVELINTDKNGIDGLTIIKITRNSEEECDDEFFGQINDGFFENCIVTKDYPVEVKEVNI